jgi:tetratricopeptide (TPR) repeat protein
MSRFGCSAFAVAVLFLSMPLAAPGDDTRPPAINSEIAAAERFYHLGKFAEAESSYRSLLKADSKLLPAQLGLIRAMLGQQKIDEALEVANAALAAQPDSAPLLEAKGDVQFRRGEMADSEMSYLAALKIDQKAAHSHLGLAKLYGAYSLFRKAYDQIQIAHSLAPDDPAVEMMWVSTLPRVRQLAAMESFSSSHSDDDEEMGALTSYLNSLRTAAETATHACGLVGKVEQTEAKLEEVSNFSARRARGVGLSTKINNQNTVLLLDTGATGILLDRRIADSAELHWTSATIGGGIGGIGDKGAHSGHKAIADRIRIGELEFRDCVVQIDDTPGGIDELTGVNVYGLVGADVFARYLVDIDLPEMRLKLSQLPRRPEDTVVPASLISEAGASPDEDGASEQTSPDQDPSRLTTKGSERLPKDRYIAPEMAGWTKVFRIGHMILVPTSVNGSKPMLFIVDTGSPGSVLSSRAGQQVSRLHSQDRVRVQGLSGSVNKVYSSSSGTLSFGHLEQKNKDIVTWDLSSMNGRTGTEVSGLLGFQLLRQLDVKLDYRDGLADFEYDPKSRKR